MRRNRLSEIRIRQIVKEELTRNLEESDQNRKSEEISYEVEVPHRENNDEEVVDAVQQAQSKAIEDYGSRSDMSEAHPSGYEVLSVRYRVYLELNRR